MNPNVIIKLEDYQNLIKQSQELKDLKKEVQSYELNKYLETNSTINIGLSIYESSIRNFPQLQYYITNYNTETSIPTDLLYHFISKFNQGLWDYQAKLEKREVTLDDNAKIYFKKLSFIQKLKLLL